MEVAYAAIPPLGFGLDLMVHKVLMRMHGGAWCEVVVLVRGWPKLETRWWRAQAKWPQVYGEATAAEVRAAGVRRRVNRVNPDPSRSTYRGVHWIYPLRFLPPYNALQQLYPDNITRRLHRIHRQQTTPRPKF
jgi:hypothetical protein